jgi:hypothetical protein
MKRPNQRVDGTGSLGGISDEEPARLAEWGYAKPFNFYALVGFQ